MDTLQSEFAALNKEKDEIESKIAACNEVLSCNSIGMDEPLIDKEDFPRSDIDVYSVRHARHNIVCLQNDHKEIMKKLEQKLYEIHEQARKTKTVSSGGDGGSTVSKQVELKPFLTVNQVATGGPAEQAGIRVGDLIKQFGSVTLNNFRDLQDIGLVVMHSKDKVVKVVLDRDSQEYRLELTPRVWSGRGLLGCNVVEIKK